MSAATAPTPTRFFVRSDEILQDRSDLGLPVPPLVWATEYKYFADAVLLVLASDAYREDDYIRDVDEYLALRGGSIDPIP